MRKSIGRTIALLGLFPVVLWAQSPKITTYSFEKVATFTNLSDNALWGTAKGKSSGDDTKDAHPYLIDITTGKSTYLLTEDESNYVISGAYDVTNDGKLVVGSYNDTPATYNVTEKKWTLLPFPASIKRTEGFASCVSPDGRFITGTIDGTDADAGSFTETPFLFVDGVYTECEGLPKVDITGQDQNQNRFVGISADGNIILGGLSFSYPGGGCSYYVYNRQSKSFKYLGLDELKDGSFVDDAYISSNGKWITGTVHMVHPIEGEIYNNEYAVPFKYDVENDTFTLYDDSDDDIDTGSFLINNSGTMFGASSFGSPYRSLKYRVGEFWYGMDIVLKEKYDIDYTTLGFENTGTPIAISDDGKTIVSLPLTGTSYVVTLPETFEGAAKAVNLLASAYLNPLSGTSFSKLSTIKLVFDRAVEKKTGATVSLYKNDELVSSSISIVANNSDNREYVIGFRPVTLDDKTVYTVKVKAGSFGIPNSDISNKEIVAKYIGRSNIPVYPTQIAPADGSKVSELSYSSPMTIQFDVPILLKEGVTGELYQEGNTDPICKLILSSSSNMMAFYPTLTQYLYKDVEYRVEIPAEAATDIMGNCANEAITLHYTGIYQRTAPSVGDNLFEESFDDPANALTHFLLYDGDKNEPNATAKAWGFDKENTPWNFSILESSNSDDYCAGSVSMYSPAGKSDDWMSTVQLTVPDNSYVLYWKSQSFKKDKTDRLKVYVWEYDNELSVLNAELIASIQKDGTLVYDEIELPGESEKELANDWVEHKVSLANYAGKNIYIAFANQNDDQSAIFVDDIRVVFEGTYAVGSTTETSVVNQSKIKVEGFVKVVGDETYSSLKAYYKAADGTVVDERTLSGLNLKKGDIESFTFEKELPLTVGKRTAYSICVEMGNETKEAKYTINNLAFLPQRKVVIEEATGAWCANCPQGILAFEDLQKLFPEQFIPIAVHGGGSDPYPFSSYISYLGASAFPSGKVNRSEKFYFPMLSENGKYSFTSQSGDNTFKDIFLKELEKASEAEVKLNIAGYDIDQNKIVIGASANYAIDIDGGNYNIFCAILEDDLTAIQQNNLYNMEDEIMGDFGKNGIYGVASPKIKYNHVARNIIGASFNGLGGYIPSTITANDPISFTIESTLPSSVKNMENASVVCILLNANTGQVINADHLKFTKGTGIEQTVADKNSDVKIRIDGKQVSAEFTNAGKAVVTLYDMSGMVIDQAAASVNAGESMTTYANGHTGVILVRTVLNGMVTVKKVVIE